MGRRTFQTLPRPKVPKQNKSGNKRGEGKERIKKRKGNKVNQGEYRKVMKAAIQDIESRYYNPDPLFRLIGESNEASIQVDGNKLPALIDSGAQVSAMTQKLANQMKLKVHKLNKLLRIEGTGGGKVPYKGYVETLLEIPEMPDFKEYVLMLVIEDSEYGNRVPIQLGTLHIDMILEKAKPEQLVTLGKAYKHREVGRSIQSKGVMELGKVCGPIKLTKSITLEAGETVKVNGLSQLKGNVKRLHVVAEPIRYEGGSEVPQIVTIPTYSVCMPGSQKVTVMLRNITNDVITLAKGKVVAELAADNLVPNKIAPRFIEEKENSKLVKSGQLQVGKKKRTEKLMEKLELSGMKTWSKECQIEAEQTMKDFEDIFALESLELGRTKLVKHTIKVNNPILFKERYRRILPHQFKEVRKHL